MDTSLADSAILKEEPQVMSSGAIKHMTSELASIYGQTGIRLKMDDILLARWLWGNPDDETASDLAKDPLVMVKIYADTPPLSWNCQAVQGGKDYMVTMQMLNSLTTFNFNFAVTR